MKKEKKFKKIGMLFGSNFYLETDNEETLKKATNWFEDLEARERRIRNKEIELDLRPY